MANQRSPLRVDISTPVNPIGVGTFKVSPKAVQYVNQVLQSERLSYGPFLQKFESVFAAAHDCQFGVMTNSGTSSLLIALHALMIRHGWCPGDEVLVPSVTFVATANVCLQLGLKPVFVDVDPIYYEICPQKAEKAITSKTRAMIPVHLFGLPCDMAPLWNLAKAHGLRIVEDSCETMFTHYQGKSVGSLGDIGCFSTYVAHLLVTGVGGLCTTNDPELAVLLRSLMNHGRDSIYLSIDDDKGKSEEELKLVIQRRFRFIHPGYSFRVTEMEGALGLAQFEGYPEMMEKRRKTAELFLRELKPLEAHLQLPTLREGSGHAFMMFPLVLRNERKKNLVEHLELSGIETRDMLPLVNQPVYEKILGTKETDFPVAKWINESGFYIACHQDLSELDKDHILQTLYGYFRGKRSFLRKSALVVFSNLQGKQDRLVLQNRAESLSISIFEEKWLADASGMPEVTEAYSACGFKVVSAKNSRESAKSQLLKEVLSQSEAEDIVLIGSDGTDAPEDAAKLLLQLQYARADLVVASRFLPGGGRYESRSLSARSIGNRFFNFVLQLLTRKNVTDAHNLFRAFRRGAFETWAFESGKESFTYEMTAQALRRGLRYWELPTQERAPLFNYRKSNRLYVALQFVGVWFGLFLSPKKRIENHADLESSPPKYERSLS